MYNKDIEKWLKIAASEAKIGVKLGHGGPFGAVIVLGGRLIAKAHNKVLINHDPTAHAEIEVIRKAAKKLKTHDLFDCEIYSSCEPCPMCMGAILWSRLKTLVFGAQKSLAADAGFDDENFHKALKNSAGAAFIEAKYIRSEECEKTFILWSEKTDRKIY